MSVQDTIAGQNLSAANASTALEMIKIQAQNRRAKLAAGVDIRNQDITRENNLANNALKQQEIDLTGEQNAFNRYAKERELGNQDKTAARSDYQTYVQGDRQLANQEQQTANQYELGKGQLSVQARGQDITARGQDLDMEKAYLQNQIMQRQVGVQEGELGLKAQQEQLKREQESIAQEAFSKGGLVGAAAAYISSKPEVSAKLLETDQQIKKYTQERDAVNNAAIVNEYGARAAAEKDPAMRLQLLREGAVKTGLPQEIADGMDEASIRMYHGGIGLNGKDVAEKTQNQIKALVDSGVSPDDPRVQSLTSVFAPKNQTIINNQPDNYIAKARADVYGDRLKDINTRAQKQSQFADTLNGMYQAMKDNPAAGYGYISDFAANNPTAARTFEIVTGKPMNVENIRAFTRGQVQGAKDMKSDSQVSQQELDMNRSVIGGFGDNPEGMRRAVELEKAKALRTRAEGEDLDKWVSKHGSETGFDARRNAFKNNFPVIDSGGNVIERNINMPDIYFDKDFKPPSTNNNAVLQNQKEGKPQQGLQSLPTSEIDRLIAEAEAKGK